MDITQITNIISTIGFPIVMCIIIFKHLDKEREDHKEEITSLKDILSDTKNVIAELKQLIQDKLA